MCQLIINVYYFYLVIEAISVDTTTTEDITFSNKSISIIIPLAFIRCRSKATGTYINVTL